MADQIREYVIKIRAEVQDALSQIDQLTGKFDKIEVKTKIDKGFESSIEKLSSSIGKITQEMGELKKSFKEVDFKSFTGDMKSSFDDLKSSIDDIKSSAKTLAEAFDFSGKSNNGFQNFINDLNKQISDLAQKYQESVQKINEMASQGFVPKGSPASGQNGIATAITEQGQQFVTAADKVVQDVDKETKELTDAINRFQEAVNSYNKNKSSIKNVINRGPQEGRELESIQETLAVTQELIEATKELEKYNSQKRLIQNTFSQKDGGIGITRAELNREKKDLLNFRQQISDANASEKDAQVIKTKVRFQVDYDILNSDDAKEQSEQIKNIVDNIREKVTNKVQKEMMNHPIRIPISFGSYEEMKKEYEKAERQTDKAVKELTDEKHEKSLIRELELKVTAKTDGLIDDINTKIKEINEQIQTTIDVQINPVVPEKKDIGLAITRTENAIKDKIADLGSDEGIPIDFSGVIKGNVGTLNVADNRTHELLSAIQGVTEAILSRMGNLPPNGGGGGSYPMIRNTPPTPPTTPTSGNTQQGMSQTPIQNQIPQTSTKKLNQPNISQQPVIKTNKDINVDGGKVIVQSPTETQNKNQPAQSPQQNISQVQTAKAVKELSLDTLLQTGLMGSGPSRPPRTPNQLINSARKATLGTSALKGLFAGYVDANKLNAAKIFGQEKLVEGSKSLLSYIKNPSYGEKKYKEKYYNASYKNGSGSGEYAYYGLSGQTLEKYQEMADEAFSKGRAAIEQHIQEINEKFEDALTSQELVIPDLLGRADGKAPSGKKGNVIAQYGTDIKVPKWAAMLLEDDSRKMKNELTGETFKNEMEKKKKEDPGFFDRKRRELPKSVNSELQGLYSEREKLGDLLDREVFDIQRQYEAIESISKLLNKSETFGDFKQGYKGLNVIAKDMFEEFEELQDLLNTNNELYPVIRESIISSIDEKKNSLEDEKTKREKQYSKEISRYDYIDESRIPTLETRKKHLSGGSDQQVLEESIKQTHEEYRKNLLHYTGTINKEYEEQLRKLQKKQIDSIKEKDAKEAITSLFGANAFKEPKDQSVSIIDIKNPEGQRQARILESLGLKVDPKTGNLISFTGQDYDKNGNIVDGYLGSPLLTSSEWAYEDLEERILLLGKFGQKMLDHQMEITSALSKNENVYREYANRYKKISTGEYSDEDVAYIVNHYNDIASLLKTETSGIGSADFQTLDVTGNPDAKKVKESVLRVLNEKENGMFDENDVYNAVSAQLQAITDSRATERDIYRNHHRYQQEMVKKERTNYMSPETYKKYLKRAAELDKEKIYYRKKMRVTNNGFDRLSLTPYELDRYNQVDSESKDLRNKIYAYEVGTGKRDIHGGLIDKSAFDVTKMSDKWMDKATVKIGSFNLTATDPELAKDYLKIAQGSAGSASGEVVDRLITTLSGHIESMPKTDVEKREIALGMLQKDIDGLEIELQKVDAELQEAQDFNEKNKVSIDQGLINPKDIGNENRGLLGKKKKLEGSIASLKDDSGKSATMQLLKSQIDEIQTEIDARNEWNEKNREDINRRFLREKSTYELETRRGHLQKQYDAVAADGGTQASAEIIANEQRLVDLRKEESDLITKVSDKTGVGEVLKGMIEDVRLAKEKERIANENVANFAYEDAHRRPNLAYTISVDSKTGDLIKTPIEPSTEENVANQIIRAVFGDDALPGFKFSGVPGYDSLGFKNEEDVGKYYASLLDYALDAKEEREYAQEKLAEIWNKDYTNEILQDLGVRGNNELGQLMDQLLENRQQQEEIRGELDILRGITSDKSRKSIDPTRNGDYRNQRIQTYIDQINQQQTDVESALSHLLYLRGDTSLVQSAEKAVRERESFEKIAKHRKETIMKQDEEKKSDRITSKINFARNQLTASTEQQYANIEADKDLRLNNINTQLDSLSTQLDGYEATIVNRFESAVQNVKNNSDKLSVAEEKLSSELEYSQLSMSSYLEDFQRFMSGYKDPKKGLQDLAGIALNSMWDLQDAISDNIPKDRIAELVQDYFNYSNMLQAGGYSLDYFINSDDANQLTSIFDYIRKEFPEVIFQDSVSSANKEVENARSNLIAAKEELQIAERAFNLVDNKITKDIISLLQASETADDFKQGIKSLSPLAQLTVDNSKQFKELLSSDGDIAFKNNKESIISWAKSTINEDSKVGNDYLAIQYSETVKAIEEKEKEQQQVNRDYETQRDYIKQIAELREKGEDGKEELDSVFNEYAKYLANRIGVIRERFRTEKVQDTSSGETRTKYTTETTRMKASDLTRQIGSGKTPEEIRKEREQHEKEIEEKEKEEAVRSSSQNRLDIARHEQSPEYKKVDKKMQELKETRIAESNKSREDSFFGWRYANMTDDQAEVTHIIDSLTKTQNKLGKLNTKQEWLLSTSVQRAKELGLTLNKNGLVSPLVPKEDYELNPSNYTLPHMSIEELQRRKLIRSKKKGSPYVKPKELDEEYFQYQSEEELLDRWYSNYTELESSIDDQIDEQEKILANMHEAELKSQPQSQQKKSQIDKNAVSLIAAKSAEDYEDRILLGIEQGLHLGIKKGESPTWYPQNKLDQMQQNGFMDATDQIKANSALAAQIAQEYYKSADASSSAAQAAEGEAKAGQVLTNASNSATAALNSQAEATGKVVDMATKQKELEQKKQSQQQPQLKKEIPAAAPKQPKVGAPVITKDGVDFNGKHYSLIPKDQQISLKNENLKGVFGASNSVQRGKQAGIARSAANNILQYLQAYSQTGNFDFLNAIESQFTGNGKSKGLYKKTKEGVRRFVSGELAKRQGTPQAPPTTLPPQPKIEPKDVAPVQQMADAQKEAAKTTAEQIQKTEQLKALLKDLNAGEFREQVGGKYKQILGELTKEGSTLTPEDAAKQVRAYLGELQAQASAVPKVNSQTGQGSRTAQNQVVSRIDRWIADARDDILQYVQGEIDIPADKIRQLDLHQDFEIVGNELFDTFKLMFDRLPEEIHNSLNDFNAIWDSSFEGDILENDEQQKMLEAKQQTREVLQKIGTELKVYAEQFYALEDSMGPLWQESDFNTIKTITSGVFSTLERINQENPFLDLDINGVTSKFSVPAIVAPTENGIKQISGLTSEQQAEYQDWAFEILARGQEDVSVGTMTWEDVQRELDELEAKYIAIGQASTGSTGKAATGIDQIEQEAKEATPAVIDLKNALESIGQIYSSSGREGLLSSLTALSAKDMRNIAEDNGYVNAKGKLPKSLNKSQLAGLIADNYEKSLTPALTETKAQAESTTESVVAETQASGTADTSGLKQQEEALKRVEDQARETKDEVHSALDSKNTKPQRSNIREENERILTSLGEFSRTGVPRSLKDILADIDTINQHIAIATQKTDEAVIDDIGARYGIGYGGKKLKRTGKKGQAWLNKERETKASLNKELQARLEISKTENPDEYFAYTNAEKIRDRDKKILSAIDPNDPFKYTIQFPELRDATELTEEYSDALAKLGYTIKEITTVRGVESKMIIAPIDGKAITDMEKAQQILDGIGQKSTALPQLSQTETQAQETEKAIITEGQATGTADTSGTQQQIDKMHELTAATRETRSEVASVGSATGNQTPVSTAPTLPLKEESEAQQETGTVAQQSASQVEAAEAEKQNAIEQTNERLREQQHLEEQVAKYPNRPEKYRNLNLEDLSDKELNRLHGTAKREYGQYRKRELHDAWGVLIDDIEKEKIRRPSATPQIQDKGSTTKQDVDQSAQAVVEAEKTKQAAIEETTAKINEQKQAQEQLTTPTVSQNKPNALIDYYKKYHSDWDAQKMQEEASKMTTGMVDSFKAGGRPGFKFTGSEQQLEYIQAINTELEKMGYQLTKVQSGDQSYVKISELSTATEQATQAMTNEATAADSAKQSLEGKATAEQQAAEGAKQNAQASQQVADTVKPEASAKKVSTQEQKQPSKIDEIISSYKSVAQNVGGLVEGESTDFSSLLTMLRQTIPQAVDIKNNAFMQEAQLVQQFASEEATAFQPLIENLQKIAGLATNLKFDFRIQGGEQFTSEFIEHFGELKEEIDGVDPSKFEMIGKAVTSMGSGFTANQDLVKTFEELGNAVKTFAQNVDSTELYGNFNQIAGMVERIAMSGDKLKNMADILKSQKTGKYSANAEMDSYITDLKAELKYMSQPNNIAEYARVYLKKQAQDAAILNGEDLTQSNTLTGKESIFLANYENKIAMVQQLGLSVDSLKHSMEDLGQASQIPYETIEQLIRSFDNLHANIAQTIEQSEAYSKVTKDYSAKLAGMQEKINLIPEEEQKAYAGAFGQLKSEFKDASEQLKSGEIVWEQYTARMNTAWQVYNKFKRANPAGSINLGTATGSSDDVRNQLQAMLQQRYKLVTENVSGGAIDSNGMAKFSAQVVDAQNNVRNLKITWDTFSGSLSATVNTASEQFKGRFMNLFTDLQAKSKQLFVYWTATFLNPYRLIGVVKQVVNIVKELDTAMMELRKVSSETADGYKDFQTKSFSMADEVGGTAKDIITATTNWKKLGKTFEEAQVAGQASVKMLNVSEFTNIDDATTALVSMKQAFNDLSYDDFIDKLNAVGDSYSSATDQLAEGMKNVSAVMKVQGNDIDQTLALLTAAKLLAVIMET